MHESPSGICLRFSTDTGVIGIGGRGALGRGAQTAASVQSISFDRDFLQQRNAWLKRPYDGCGSGEGALLRAPGLRAQVSGVGKGMTCRVDYVLAVDAADVQKISSEVLRAGAQSKSVCGHYLLHRSVIVIHAQLSRMIYMCMFFTLIILYLEVCVQTFQARRR